MVDLNANQKQILRELVTIQNGNGGSFSTDQIINNSESDFESHGLAKLAKKLGEYNIDITNPEIGLKMPNTTEIPEFQSVPSIDIEDRFNTIADAFHKHLNEGVPVKYSVGGSTHVYIANDNGNPTYGGITDFSGETFSSYKFSSIKDAYRYAIADLVDSRIAKNQANNGIGTLNAQTADNYDSGIYVDSTDTTDSTKGGSDDTSDSDDSTDSTNDDSDNSGTSNGSGTSCVISYGDKIADNINAINNITTDDEKLRRIYDEGDEIKALYSWDVGSGRSATYYPIDKRLTNELAEQWALDTTMICDTTDSTDDSTGSEIIFASDNGKEFSRDEVIQQFVQHTDLQESTVQQYANDTLGRLFDTYRSNGDIPTDSTNDDSDDTSDSDDSDNGTQNAGIDGEIIVGGAVLLAIVIYILSR